MTPEIATAAGVGTAPPVSRATLHYVGGQAALSAAVEAARSAGLSGTSTVPTLGTWCDGTGQIVVEDSYATTLVGPNVLDGAAAVAAAIFGATKEQAVLVELWDLIGYAAAEIGREAVAISFAALTADRLGLRAAAVAVPTNSLEAAA